MLALMVSGAVVIGLMILLQLRSDRNYFMVSCTDWQYKQRLKQFFTLHSHLVCRVWVFYDIYEYYLSTDLLTWPQGKGEWLLMVTLFAMLVL